MVNFEKITFFINLAMLLHIIWIIVPMGKWTTGKKVIILLISVQTWNYLWTCVNILVTSSFLDSVRTYGYQFPTLIVLLVVTYMLRSGNDSDS